ncbi:MAG: carbon-nitrogen hydrolase family protein [Chitinispirillia bacterium]|jgi:predicted amidohydrolase
MKTIRAAICQNKTEYDKEYNISHALDLINRAADNGAQLLCMGEIFYYPYDLSAMRSIADNDTHTLECLQLTAQKLCIYLCTGSLSVRKGKNIQNTAYLIGKNGEILIEYSKSHLFDVQFRELRVKESLVFDPGSEIRVAKTDIGNIGILICYDIRFPETARTCTLKGAEVILVPAAFNMVTGPAHWHILFRTRAMENQVFVLAASQARVKNHNYIIYGHSLIVDPWGKVLKDAGVDESIIYAELNSKTLQEIRERMPLLKHRNPLLYSL